jgi:hypothetical protein
VLGLALPTCKAPLGRSPATCKEAHCVFEGIPRGRGSRFEVQLRGGHLGGRGTDSLDSYAMLLVSCT